MRKKSLNVVIRTTFKYLFLLPKLQGWLEICNWLGAYRTVIFPKSMCESSEIF